MSSLITFIISTLSSVLSGVICYFLIHWIKKYF